jgi:short-subunit dehydrogenase
MQIKNQTILITGASSGIGAEFAVQFAAKGANLVLCARRLSDLEKLAQSLREQYQIKVSVLAVDLTNYNDSDKLLGLNSLAEYIKSNELNGLVNNAGCGSFGYFEELDLEIERRMIRLNIEATIVLAHAIIPQLKQRRSGLIISVSSVAAFQPLPLMATYAATKAFNFVHSMALRSELAEFGVRVHTLCPGPTATEFGGVARVPGTMTGGFRDSVQDVVSATLKSVTKNKGFVIPGWRSFIMSLSSRFLPTGLTCFLVLRALLPAYKMSKGGKKL